MDISAQNNDEVIRAGLEQALSAGLEAGELIDATVAASIGQRQMLWKLRESIPEAHKHEGISFKHDISVPISRVPEFLARIESDLEKTLPGLRIFTFPPWRRQPSFQSVACRGSGCSARRSAES
jgi:FAD/FMN-containing dehydrogenase